jgi:hypothetical protein
VTFLLPKEESAVGITNAQRRTLIKPTELHESIHAQIREHVLIGYLTSAIRLVAGQAGQEDADRYLDSISCVVHPWADPDRADVRPEHRGQG